MPFGSFLRSSSMVLGSYLQCLKHLKLLFHVPLEELVIMQLIDNVHGGVLCLIFTQYLLACYSPIANSVHHNIYTSQESIIAPWTPLSITHITTLLPNSHQWITVLLLVTNFDSLGGGCKITSIIHGILFPCIILLRRLPELTNNTNSKQISLKLIHCFGNCNIIEGVEQLPA